MTDNFVQNQTEVTQIRIGPFGLFGWVHGDVRPSLVAIDETAQDWLDPRDRTDSYFDFQGRWCPVLVFDVHSQEEAVEIARELLARSLAESPRLREAAQIEAARSGKRSGGHD
jgi:hypothetical protein